jgi:hypothetical protein
MKNKTLLQQHNGSYRFEKPSFYASQSLEVLILFAGMFVLSIAALVREKSKTSSSTSFFQQTIFSLCIYHFFYDYTHL